MEQGTEEEIFSAEISCAFRNGGLPTFEDFGGSEDIPFLSLPFGYKWYKYKI